MTVDELKRALEGVPGDMEVAIEAEEYFFSLNLDAKIETRSGDLHRDHGTPPRPYFVIG